MSQIKQSQAVKEAVFSVLEEAGITVDGNESVRQYMTAELRAKVNQILFEGFRSGRIAFKDTESNRAKLENETELRKYVSGLQTNWLNKSKDLNGGVEYVAKNPGIRAGASDPQIKALRALRASLTDLSEIQEIDNHIQTRLNELKAVKPVKAKAKTPKVDFESLPEELRSKYSA
jgi:hypothetical protein